MYTLNKESTEIQQIIKTLGYATCAYQQERIEEEKTEWVSDESFAREERGGMSQKSTVCPSQHCS
jgi:hypothetical protein